MCCDFQDPVELIPKYVREWEKGYKIVIGIKTCLLYTSTDRIMNDTFWVGVYPGMTDEMIDYMAKTIKEAVDQQ